MENNRILSPHYLEAYNYFYSVIDNKMYFKQKRVYYSLEQVLHNSPERSCYEFPITFVKVMNDGKVMHKYVVYEGKVYDMYDGDIEYRKTRVFVLTGTSDDDRRELVYVVHIGYEGLYYHVIGMDGTTDNFEVRTIDWDSEDKWNVAEYDEPDSDMVECMDFMAMLANNNHENITKESLDVICTKCVYYGFMRETPAPPVYLKDIVLDKLFENNNEDIPF